MNTNESEFESELRTLRPLAPSHELEEGIARQLASRRALAIAESRSSVIRRRESELEVARPGLFDRIFPGFRWAFAGAAAAVAIAGAIRHFDQSAVFTPVAAVVAAAPTFEEESVTREFVSAEDHGIIYEGEQEPARLVRYTMVEHHVWMHPVTGARLEVEVPREDLVLVPVAMQ